MPVLIGMSDWFHVLIVIGRCRQRLLPVVELRVLMLWLLAERWNYSEDGLRCLHSQHSLLSRPLLTAEDWIILIKYILSCAGTRGIVSSSILHFEFKQIYGGVFFGFFSSQSQNSKTAQKRQMEKMLIRCATV
jgi:hypothetical protein